MHLYEGTSVAFVEDSTLNRIGDKIAASFFDHFRYRPPASEVGAWRNSLKAMADTVDYAKLNDHGVIVEWQLPLSSRRLDVLLTGRDPDGRDGAVIVELKQWDQAFPTTVQDCVVAFVGGRKREVLHPSAQVGGYQTYLQDTHTAFSEGEVGLQGCAFLHNMRYDPASEIFDRRHADLLAVNPVFTGDQTTVLAGYLQDRLGEGGGIPVLDTVLAGRYRPHKKLLEHTARMIQGEPTYILLDEQRVAFNSVLARVAEASRTGEKAIFLIRGGPGTGKSVIALNLVAELSRLGYVTHHATGSRAFTENVRKVVGRRAGVQFKYFNSYRNDDPEVIDVIVCDEAHRIREASYDRFTPRGERSGRPQIDELVAVARVPVFFIDDLQVVRPGEIGSSDLIRQAAATHEAPLHEYELETQFRCGGSEAFIGWVESTLGIARTPYTLWEADEDFEFDVVDSPGELQALINQKAAVGHSARLVAGFCWPWSNPNSDGTLVDDVRVDGWQMPWNAKPEASGLAAGIPKSHFWASDPNGLNQVGCIYTAQGFEFDYVGVIFGRDLVHRARDGWVGQAEFSKDSVVRRAAKDSAEAFTSLVKQTYRVLLTRGLKGCYVYFEDPATRDFFLSRVEPRRAHPVAPAEETAQVEEPA
ncbi:MAG: DUF2075 domain-containing protein [Spirochaetales bacterium]|nr:DUF2075 domain-containing protein [Spirochaetales bacterium]